MPKHPLNVIYFPKAAKPIPKSRPKPKPKKKQLPQGEAATKLLSMFAALINLIDEPIKLNCYDPEVNMDELYSQAVKGFNDLKHNAWGSKNWHRGLDNYFDAEYKIKLCVAVHLSNLRKRAEN